MSNNVLLLRSPPETLPDPYDSVLRNALYNSYSIPVLETSFVNLSNLQNIINAGPQSKDYVGVIITSKRSCEAWTTALKIHLDSTSHHNHLSSGQLWSPLATWTQTPFYVVGKGTASALEDFQTMCSNIGIQSQLDIRGEHTGTGEQLAHFILDDITGDTAHNNKRLLYLTGDKNRDTIPKILSSQEGERRGVELDTIQVYETHGASNFEPNLDLLIKKSSEASWWIVFFAPSSAGFAYPILRKHFRFNQSETLTPNSVPSHLPLPMAKIAAIGRVTSSYIEEELKLHVDATATKPTPDALLAAISAATA